MRKKGNLTQLFGQLFLRITTRYATSRDPELHHYSSCPASWPSIPQSRVASSPPPPAMPDTDVDTEMREAAAAAAPAGDDDGEGDTEEEEEEDDEVDDDDDEEEEELPAAAPAPAEEQPAPAPISALPGNPNQLTLVFQGEVYVFESVTPEKVSPRFIPFCFVVHVEMLLENSCDRI